MIISHNEDINTIWLVFEVTRSEQDRSLLLRFYLHIVTVAADYFFDKSDKKVPKKDILIAGMFGLMDAVDSFNPYQGTNFEDYCRPIIHKAIKAELEEQHERSDESDDLGGNVMEPRLIIGGVIECSFVAVCLLSSLFVYMRLRGWIDWSWWWITAPVLGYILVLLIVFALFLLICCRTDKKQQELRRL